MGWVVGSLLNLVFQGTGTMGAWALLSDQWLIKLSSIDDDAQVTTSEKERESARRPSTRARLRPSRPDPSGYSSTY